MTPHSHTEHSTATGAPGWLASLLLRRDDILPRFAFHYRRLAQQSRPWRRQLRRKLAVTIGGAALLLALAGPVGGPAVEAAADNVITVANAEVRVATNGKCSLSEAIRNANNTTNGRPHADCAAGNPTGPDTINLPANGTFTLIAADNTGDFGPNGLPWVGSAITINGNGSTIQRSPSAPDFRILAIGPNGNLALNSTTITGGRLSSVNRERLYGAGILNQGTLIIQDSTVAGNEIDSGYDANGGGVFSEGILTISNSVVRDNFAIGAVWASGGGIQSHNSLTLANSSISGNRAVSLGAPDYSSAIGGGIMSRGTLNISNSEIINNEAYGYGSYDATGGGIFNSGAASISRSTVTGNKAESSHESYYDGSIISWGEGGGIANNWWGDLEIVNSTISNNQAPWAGGGLLNRGDTRIYNSTITGNDKQGIYTYCYGYGSYAETVLRSSIVSGNSSGEAGVFRANECYYDNMDVMTVDSNNLFGHSGQAGVSGFDLGASDFVPSVGLNSILLPLANNGGSTQTHALPAGSPAIDQVMSWPCDAAPISGRDQRGQPRNANGAGGVTDKECDVGAFEFQPTAAAPSLLISPTTAGAVGGVAFTPADILKFDPAAGWSLYFDGSDVGVTKNVAAFELLGDGDILMSFIANQPIPSVGTFAPHDVARFHPTATGPNTAGTFAWFLDGSTRGLSTAGEKIDALAETEQGFPMLSVSGAASVPRLNGGVQKAQDEDALGYNPDTGSWWLAFDGTAVPGLGVEDVNALWRDPATGDLYLSIIGAFNLSGVKGDGKDIVKLSPNGSGGYTPSLFWDGSAAGFPSNVDGLEIVP